MNVSSSLGPAQRALQTTPMVHQNVQPTESTPEDTFTFGDSSPAAIMAIGGGVGAVTIGATTALGMGAVKSFLNGNTLAGLGLAAGTVVSAGTLGIGGLTAAAMSGGRDGDPTGFMSYLAGGALATTAAGFAIF